MRNAPSPSLGISRYPDPVQPNRSARDSFVLSVQPVNLEEISGDDCFSTERRGGVEELDIADSSWIVAARL